MSKGIQTNIRINTGPSNLERVHLLKKVFADRGLTDSPKFGYYFAPTQGEAHSDANGEISCRGIVEALTRNGFEKRKQWSMCRITAAI